MPELPEVESVVRSLQPLVIGRTIIGAEFQGSKPAVHLKLLKNSVQEFQRGVCGAYIEQVERYGKNIVFQLRHGEGSDRRLSLLVHLGMTGRLTCENTPERQTKHTHLVLSLDDPTQWIHYADIRRFGRLRVTGRVGEELTQLGPDPLEISEGEFCELLRSRNAMLKGVLLDQHFLRGIGNIYADESLFRAGIHPATRSARLGRKRALRLHQAIQETLEEAIESGGSSISDYVDAQGRAGTFQQMHQVYCRTDQPCLRCGARIKKIIISSRSTHFCPRCQR